MKIKTNILTALTLPLIATAGFAGTMETAPQTHNGPTFYVQGGLGLSQFQKMDGNEKDRSANFAFDAKAGVLLKSDSNVRLGAEFGYVNLGTQDFRYTYAPDYVLTGELQQSGVDLLAVLYIGMNDKAAIVTKLGGAYVRQNIDVHMNGLSGTLPEEKEFLPEVALGLHYNINEKIALTGEWRYIDGSENDQGMPIPSTNTFTIGAKINLG